MTLTVVSRADWGARPPKKNPTRMALPKADLYVHHEAAVFTSLKAADEIGTMRDIQKFHMTSRGWNDIAYSFVVFPSGRVYEGRGWGVVGAHTEGYNSKGHAICFTGHYEVQQPTEQALEAVRQLIRLGVASHAVTAPFKLFGHRDLNSTACPGKNLYPRIPELYRAPVGETVTLTEVKPMFDPALQIVAYLDCPTGGSWLLGKDGAVYAVGGAPYLGGCNGKDYFAGRTAARLELADGKYRILATSGEGYGPGF